MKVTEWLAIYGAALSTVLALARAWAHFFGPRSIVRVTLLGGNVVRGPQGQAVDQPMYLVGVVNRGTHAINIDGLQLITADGKTQWVLPSPALGIELPFEVPPRGRKNVALPKAAFEPPERRLQRVVVRLATGEKVASNYAD